MLGIDELLLGAGPPMTSWVPLGPALCCRTLVVSTDGWGERRLLLELVAKGAQLC